MVESQDSPQDREVVRHWIRYEKWRARERWSTINVANRIFSVPVEKWAKWRGSV